MTAIVNKPTTIVNSANQIPILNSSMLEASNSTINYINSDSFNSTHTFNVTTGLITTLNAPTELTCSTITATTLSNTSSNVASIGNLNITGTLTHAGHPVQYSMLSTEIIVAPIPIATACVKDTIYYVDADQMGASLLFNLPTIASSNPGDTIVLIMATEIPSGSTVHVKSDGVLHKTSYLERPFAQPIWNSYDLHWNMNVATGAPVANTTLALNGLLNGGGGAGTKVVCRFLNDVDDPVGTPGKWEMVVTSTKRDIGNPSWANGSSVFNTA